MTNWLLIIKDRHQKITSNRRRTVTFEGKPSDSQLAFEKGSACLAWYCMPHELDVTLMEWGDDKSGR